MQHRSVRSVAVAGLVLALFLGACGGSDDDDSPPESATPTTPVEAQAGDVTSFCELTEELDKAGGKFFAELEKDDNATAKDYQEAEKAFAEAHKDDFAELAAVAPPEVREDVAVVLASISARAGIGPKVPQKEATAAEDDLRKFEDANC